MKTEQMKQIEKIIEKIVSMSHVYFNEHPANAETIWDFISRAKGFYSEYKLDEKKLFNILKSIHNNE